MFNINNGPDISSDYQKSKPHILILNSTHGKYPVGIDPWIQVTARVIESLCTCDVQMVCSTEPIMWNLITYLAGVKGMNITLIMKCTEDSYGHREYRKILEEFSLDENRVIPLFLGKKDRKRLKELWRVRDRLALEVTDVVYPVSIRPGGRLENMLSEKNFKEKVRGDFSIPWTRDTHRPQYKFENTTFSPLPPGNWLIHWTRSSKGPWPGEKVCEFFYDLFAYPSCYVRSASETLIRILKEKVIYGSSWRMPDGVAAVSFTSLPPEDAISLMRWRKRFVRYSFEPFGIAIKQDVLVEMGAREVQYTDQVKHVFHEDRLFFQSPGKIGDWVKEKEWRVRGNLNLSAIKQDDMVVLVPDKHYLEYFKKKLPPDFRIHTVLKN